MGKLTDYKGDVLVETAVCWRLDERSGSMLAEGLAKDPALALGYSWLSSDRVQSIFITKRGLEPPMSKVPIAQPLAGLDRKDFKICDLERAAYRLGPINTTELQVLIDIKDVAVELTWSFREIFELVLREWQAAGDKTLANREDTDPLLAAIIAAKHLGSKQARVPFEYNELRARVAVDGKIIGQKCEMSDGGVPSVQLEVELLPAANIRDGLIRALCAAQWTTLSAAKAKAPVKSSKLSRGHRCCFFSLQHWIAATVDMNRGRKIQASIIKLGAGQTDAKQLVTKVRAEIDKYLIAANHWGEARETVNSSDPVERYQARMSDFFGMLYEQHTLASPVNIARGLYKAGGFGINLFERRDYEPSLWLQLGVGHCGEHAMAGFCVLRDIMKAKPGGPITSIVQSGNANIDHAFVLVNLAVDFIFKIRVLSSQNQLFEVGTEIDVFDLAGVLQQPGNTDALVHDAYLQLSRFEASASKLLDSLQSKRNKALHTTFVLFRDAYPNSPSVLSMLDSTDQELREEFPNI